MEESWYTYMVHKELHLKILPDTLEVDKSKKTFIPDEDRKQSTMIFYRVQQEIRN